MKISLILVSAFLTWAAYDPQLFRRRRGSLSLSAIELSLSEYQTELKQTKQEKRHRLDVIPPEFKKQKKSNSGKCNYFSTKPRDVRFSNQRKIRRMFNNM